MARAELALSQAAVGYARQASGVRVAPRSIGLITAKAEIAAPADALLRISSSSDAGEALASFNPPHQGYRDFARSLWRCAASGRRSPASASSRARSQGRDEGSARAACARPVRHRRSGDGPESALVYDTRVASAVADFQRANGLPANGALTARTIAALSGGDPPRLEREILASMEMWRWAPRDMGATRIEVNITDYRSRLVRDGKVAHSMRVIVGKPETPTPVFSDTMRFMVVNPSWHVPQSIIRKQLAQDPIITPATAMRWCARGTTFSFASRRRAQRAGARQVHVPQRPRRLHARHAEPEPVQRLAARVQPWLRARRPTVPVRGALMEETGWSEQRLRTLLGRGERTIQFKAACPSTSCITRPSWTTRASFSCGTTFTVIPARFRQPSGSSVLGPVAGQAAAGCVAFDTKPPRLPVLVLPGIFRVGARCDFWPCLRPLNASRQQFAQVNGG